MEKIEVTEPENLSVGVLIFKNKDKLKAKQYIDLKRKVVLIVPIDGDSVYLLREHRPLLGKTVWRVPAGTMRPGDSPLKSAKRELLEEAGLIPKKISLVKYTEFMGWVKFPVYIFKVEGVKKVKQRPDFYEKINLKKVSRDEARKIALDKMEEPHHSFAVLKCLE